MRSAHHIHNQVLSLSFLEAILIHQCRDIDHALIRDSFLFLMEDDLQKNKLRQFLQEIAATALEKILFGGESDIKINASSSFNLTDPEITTASEEINKSYQFSMHQAHFKEFKSCYIISAFVLNFFPNNTNSFISQLCEISFGHKNILWHLKNALFDLYLRQLDNKIYFRFLIPSKTPNDITKKIIQLHEMHLTDFSLNFAILSSSNPTGVINALDMLKTNALTTTKYKNKFFHQYIIENADCAEQLAYAFHALIAFASSKNDASLDLSDSMMHELTGVIDFILLHPRCAQEIADTFGNLIATNTPAHLISLFCKQLPTDIDVSYFIKLLEHKIFDLEIHKLFSQMANPQDKANLFAAILKLKEHNFDFQLYLSMIKNINMTHAQGITDIILQLHDENLLYDNILQLISARKTLANFIAAEIIALNKVEAITSLDQFKLVKQDGATKLIKITPSNSYWNKSYEWLGAFGKSSSDNKSPDESMEDTATIEYIIIKQKLKNEGIYFANAIAFIDQFPSQKIDVTDKLIALHKKDKISEQDQFSFKQDENGLSIFKAPPSQSYLNQAYQLVGQFSPTQMVGSVASSTLSYLPSLTWSKR